MMLSSKLSIDSNSNKFSPISVKFSMDNQVKSRLHWFHVFNNHWLIGPLTNPTRLLLMDFLLLLFRLSFLLGQSAHYLYNHVEL